MRTGGITLEPATVERRQSVVALNKATPVGGALAFAEGPGRHAVAVELRRGAKPALARDLVDQALRKAAAEGIAAVRVRLVNDDAAALLWKKADWLSTIKPV